MQCSAAKGAQRGRASVGGKVAKADGDRMLSCGDGNGCCYWMVELLLLMLLLWS